MSKTEYDYSIFDKFNFERKPVGIKYLLNEPEGVPQFEGKLDLCELFKEAQEREPFYVTRENVQCGEQVVGMADFPPVIKLDDEMSATFGDDFCKKPEDKNM